MNNFKNEENMKRKTKRNKVIYTCITSEKDKLLKPTFYNNDFDYLCFSNTPRIQTEPWKIIPIELEINKTPRFTARKCKILYFEYLDPKYQYSLWVDGNLDIIDNPMIILDSMIKQNIEFSVSKHPKNRSIYEEIEALKLQNGRGTTINQLSNQYNEYKKLNIPPYPVLMSRAVFRIHSDKCKKIMNKWFYHIENYSVRDQVSLSVVLNESRIKWSIFSLNLFKKLFRIKKHISCI